MKHIAIDYYNGDINVTYCGEVPKNIFKVTSSAGTEECSKCTDLYYQDHPNSNCHVNPYFDAHNPEGNSKLRAIKTEKQNNEGDCVDNSAGTGRVVEPKLESTEQLTNK